ncbi:hypothetical protein HZB07_02560 [Candidatus Saganbacteria bacterium]|nr:hypothetical protein [Candidatus Saganbacteria bacterium]
MPLRSRADFSQLFFNPSAYSRRWLRMIRTDKGVIDIDDGTRKDISGEELLRVLFAPTMTGPLDPRNIMSEALVAYSAARQGGGEAIQLDEITKVCILLVQGGGKKLKQ